MSVLTGNEIADKYAILAHDSLKAISLPNFSFLDANEFINKPLTRHLAKLTVESNNKSSEIKRSIIRWPTPGDYTRRQEAIINRLRIGCTAFTQGYLMSKEDPAICSASCSVPLSIKHILTECRNLRPGGN